MKHCASSKRTVDQVTVKLPVFYDTRRLSTTFIPLQQCVDVCYTELDEFRLHIHPLFRTVRNPAGHVLKFIPPVFEAYNNSNSQDLNNF